MNPVRAGVERLSGAGMIVRVAGISMVGGLELAPDGKVIEEGHGCQGLSCIG